MTAAKVAQGKRPAPQYRWTKCPLDQTLEHPACRPARRATQAGQNRVSLVISW
jgi:hypothetical protein